MNDLIKSSVLDEKFQKWLGFAFSEGPLTVRPDGKAAAEFVRLKKNKYAYYIYMARTGKDGSVSWNDPLAFAGVYDANNCQLYLTREALNLLASGERQFADEAGGSALKDICRRINRRVEEIIAGDRNKSA